MKDPFEEFLEDAMSGPDLELGHEMRRRLLEAAVAGETEPADNVVQISRPEPGEQEGFDWIVGETEASTPLMNRMIGDPVFLEELDQNRSFLALLRATLRKQVAAETPATGRKRLGSALAISAAAALALAAGTIFFQPAGRQTAPEVAQADTPAREETGGDLTSPAPAPAPAAVASTPTPDPAPAVAKAETAQPTEVAVMETAPTTDEAPAIPAVEPVLPIPSPAVAEESGAAIAMVGGSGQSIAPGDPLLTAAKPAPALQLAAAELALEEDADFALVQTSSSHSRMDGFWHEDRFGGSGGFGNYFASGKRNGNTVGTGPAEEDGDDSLSIPEPGAALPVLIGMMVLLMKRKRREESRGEV